MIYLASQSPRRKELLQQIGIEFAVFPVNVDESVDAGEAADDYVRRMALIKAEAAVLQVPQKWPVLAADTIVVCDDDILLKPVDMEDFVQTFKRLSGRAHEVKTAIALAYDGDIQAQVVTTQVRFRTIHEQEIIDYWHTGEPRDKAGGYGIQGIAGKFVEGINGSYSSVVGLPLMETDVLLKQLLKGAAV